MSATWPAAREDARVEGPTLGSFTINDRRVDHVTRLDEETGLYTQVSIAATPEEMRQSDIDGLRRSLDGIPYRLATVGDHFPYERPPSAEIVAERIAGLEAERDYILARLAELESAETASAETASTTRRSSLRK